MNLNNIKVLTFANGKYLNSQKKLTQHLVNIGLSQIINLNDADLPKNFFEIHKNHFSYERGFGYWIWKPYIIKNELKKLNSDEILIYIDSADFPSLEFFNFILNHFINENYLFLNRGFNHGEWTKRDCFVLMNCDNSEFYESIQLEAGVIGLKKTKDNIDLMDEWYFHMNDINILNDEPNKCNLPNIFNFKEHRHDQSILTNLVIKKNLKSLILSNSLIQFNKLNPK